LKNDVTQKRREVVSNPYQVVVAGAGPGGTLLARDLARAGVKVAVYEAGPDAASGHNWSDAVEKSALAAAGFALPAIGPDGYEGPLVKKDEQDDNLFEPHVMNRLQIWAPDLSGKTRTDVDFRYITTDRIVLNRMLRQQAVAAGAHIFYNHRADGLVGITDAPLGGIRISGLRVTDRHHKQTSEVPAAVTVDATGYRALLRTGLAAATTINRPFTKGDLAAVYRTVRQLDVSKAGDDNLTDHYRYGAYRGYFWTHRHHADVIDVGGGVKEAPDRVNPRDIVNDMIRQRPSITATELRGGGGTVLVGRSPYTLAASGFLAVGDAAGQVIPTTGCGVGGAMVGAMLAARTIIDALEHGTTGIDGLWNYNRMWFGGPGRGNHFAALAALKEILQDLSHTELAFLMRRDILSGDMLTPSINGIFEAPDVKTTLKTLMRGMSRPGLLLQLNRATTMGKKIFRHYGQYPSDWEEKIFAAWVKKADALFGRIVSSD
jgi:digeranylgeranylglycerophospholipid reductase